MPYHANRKNPLEFGIGRQALLDEIIFKDGWATINNGRGASGAKFDWFHVGR